jgi:NADPH2:quinone reductase
MEWVKSLGADHVSDQAQPLGPQVAGLGLAQPGFVCSKTRTDRHFDDIAELIAQQGRFCLLDDPDLSDFRKLERKSVSLHGELMFTRSLFEPSDIANQPAILLEISAMVDHGRFPTTLFEHFGPVNAANLRRAHALIESGQSRGKIVLKGF